MTLAERGMYVIRNPDRLDRIRLARRAINDSSIQIAGAHIEGEEVTLTKTYDFEPTTPQDLEQTLKSFYSEKNIALSKKADHKHILQKFLGGEFKNYMFSPQGYTREELSIIARKVLFDRFDCRVIRNTIKDGQAKEKVFKINQDKLSSFFREYDVEKSPTDEEVKVLAKVFEISKRVMITNNNVIEEDSSQKMTFDGRRLPRVVLDNIVRLHKDDPNFQIVCYFEDYEGITVQKYSIFDVLKNPHKKERRKAKKEIYKARKVVFSTG